MAKKANIIPNMDHSTAQKIWATSNDFIVEQNIDSTENRALKEIQLALTEEAFTLKALLETAGIQVTLSAKPFSRIIESGNGVQWAREILENLKTRTEIVSIALDQDIALDDNKGLFWIACRRFGFRPSSDIIDLISNEDVVEIYRIDQLKQVFSNFRFWNLISYPMDLILTDEFHQLFARTPALNTQIIIDSVMSSVELGRTMPVPTDEHLVTEMHSALRHHFQIKNRYSSPLTDRSTGQISAIVSTLQARRL